MGKEAEKLGRSRREIAPASLPGNHERKRHRTGSRRASEHPVLKEGSAGCEAQERWRMKDEEYRAGKMSRPSFNASVSSVKLEASSPAIKEAGGRAA